MPYVVDSENVSSIGLESSPVAESLAGLRANEARYYRNKYDHVFTVRPASELPEVVERVNRILREDRDIVIGSRPLEASAFEVDGLRMDYVFYESGLSINIVYSIEDGGKRAVGFKLAEGIGDSRGTGIPFQVRPPEIKAGRRYPRLLLRDQGRVLNI